MKRIWSVEEQQFTVDEIGYVFQFSSVHSEEVAAGNDPPDHDGTLTMRMWNREMNKCLTIIFDRNGLKVRAELDSGDGMIQPVEPDNAQLSLPLSAGPGPNWDETGEHDAVPDDGGPLARVTGL